MTVRDRSEREPYILLSDTAQSVLETEVSDITDDESNLFDDEMIAQGMRLLRDRFSGNRLLMPGTHTDGNTMAAAADALANKFDDYAEYGESGESKAFCVRARSVMTALASKLRADAENPKLQPRRSTAPGF